jgi:hypothetical protein
MTVKDKKESLLNTVQMNISKFEDKAIRSRLCAKYADVLRGFNFPEDFLEKIIECA